MSAHILTAESQLPLLVILALIALVLILALALSGIRSGREIIEYRADALRFRAMTPRALGYPDGTEDCTGCRRGDYRYADTRRENAPPYHYATGYERCTSGLHGWVEGDGKL